MPTSRPAVAGGSAKALRCRGISHAFGERRILREVDLDIAPGKTFGLIGESGSGKSTLARIVTGLQEPKEGTVELFGHPVPPRVERRSLEEKRSVQMVFQSPDMTLNPRQRLGRILAGPLRRLAGLRGRAVKARIEALFEGVRLPVDLVFKRPHALSGGQRQRVAIARAFAAAPRLIVLDEPTSALDVSVQATILNLLNDLQKTHGTSFLFISHDLKVVRYMADEIGVLYRGHLVETGPADRVFRGPNHPYTMRLLAASRDGEQIASRRVPGREEDLQSGAGCAFAPQCPVAGERCHHEPPPKRLDGEDHEIVCWLDIEALATGGAAVENPSRSAVS